MAVLLDRFMNFYGDGTKQIGRNFCIPASLCNAVRLCGVTGCTQEKVRDAWYAEQGKPIEPDLDDEMDGADIGIFETMERHIGGMSVIDNECFQRPGDRDPFDLRKADIALDFIEKHIAAGHPVIVSTWNRIPNGDIIEIHGYHMWLVLDFNRTANAAVIHDSGTDKIGQTTITKLQPITLKGKEYEIDMGLRGCITHSDYTCLALWKEIA
jgi:hypothetical protein